MITHAVTAMITAKAAAAPINTTGCRIICAGVDAGFLLGGGAAAFFFSFFSSFFSGLSAGGGFFPAS
jgi:hypothetical protein